MTIPVSPEVTSKNGLNSDGLLSSQGPDSAATTAQILSSSCFSESMVRDFNSYCLPKVRKLGMSVFEYAKVYDDGKALVLYSDPKIAHHVVRKRVHVTAHVSPETVTEQFWYVPDSHGPYSPLLRSVKELSNSAGFVDYIHRSQGYFEMYCFWSQKDQGDASTQFLNSKEALESFCYEFRDSASGLIKEADQNLFELPSAMAPNFKGLQKNEKSSSANHLQLHLEQVSRDLLKMVLPDGVKLSPRERDCVKGLIFGKTALDISKELGLSVRTVEQYFDSVKEKLGCQKKSHIVSTIVERVRQV